MTFFHIYKKIDQIEESIKLKLNKIDKIKDKYDITEEDQNQITEETLSEKSE